MDQQIRDKLIELAISCNITDDYQHELIIDEDRKIIINKARGIGVTTAIAFQKMMKVIQPEIWVRPQKENIIVSATDEQAAHVIDYVTEFWSIVKGQFPSVKLECLADKAVCNNKRWVASLACNPKTIRTWHGDVTFDEHAYFKEGLDVQFFKATSGVLTSGGQVHYISNPNGERGKFHEIWKDKKRYKYGRYEIPYTRCKRKIYLDAVKNEKRELLDWEFDEEYRCMFNPPSRGAIPNTVIEQCVDNKLKINYYRKTENPIYEGLDFAKLVDETALVDLEKTDNDVLVTYWIESLKGDYGDQEDFIVRHDTNVRPSGILGDITGVGVKIVEDLQKRIGMKLDGFAFSNPSKEKLFQGVKVRMMDRKLVIPDNEKLINQIKGIKRKVTAGGQIRYEGVSDDLFWALALAVECGESVNAPVAEKKIIENTRTKEMQQGMYPGGINDRTRWPFRRPMR